MYKVKNMHQHTHQEHADVPLPPCFPQLSHFKENINYVLKGAWVSKKIMTSHFFLYLFLYSVNFPVLLSHPTFGRENVVFT